jgi:hypothetical protein
LDAPPVYDGMAAAEDRLYLSGLIFRPSLYARGLLSYASLPASIAPRAALAEKPQPPLLGCRY